MLFGGVTATAKASEIRQVWAEIEQKREEIFEEEEVFLEEKTKDELVDFWQQMQDLVLKQSKKLPFVRIFRSGCYSFLQTLTGLAILMLMVLFVISAFVDLDDVVKVAGKIALALFYAGICVTLVSLCLYFWQSRYEWILRYRIAIQQIIAENYNLVSDYSEDVNSYAVLMLAANSFSFKTAKEVRAQRENEITEKYSDDETFIVNTKEDVADVQNVDFIERVDDAPNDDEQDASE